MDKSTKEEIDYLWLTVIIKLTELTDHKIDRICTKDWPSWQYASVLLRTVILNVLSTHYIHITLNTHFPDLKLVQPIIQTLSKNDYLVTVFWTGDRK